MRSIASFTRDKKLTALALIGLVAALVAILSPPDQLEATYQWQPSSDGFSSPLLLVEGEPDHLSLTAPCATLSAPGERVFATSGLPEKFPALVVTATGNGARLEIPANLKEPTSYIPLDLAGPIDGDCLFEIDYQQADRTLSARLLSPDDPTAAVSLEYNMPEGGGFEVTGLHWSPSVNPAGVTVAVTTSPFVTVRPSIVQIVAITIFLIAAIIGVFLAAPSLKVPRIRRLKPYPSEVAMLAFATFIMLVDIPRYDDGWNLWVAEQFVSSGSFSNLVFGQNLSTHLDLPYFLLLGALVEPFNSILGLRLLPLVLAVLTWVILRRFILPRVAPGKAALVTAWVVTATFVLAWGSTLRGEPLVIVCTVVVMALIATWPGPPNFGAARVGGLLATIGIGLSSHQTALVTLAASLAALPLVVRAFRARPYAAATASAWGLALSLLLIFANSSVSRTLEGLRRYQARTDWHSYGPLDEWRRMFDFVSYWNAAGSYLTIAFFLLGFITLLLVTGFLLSRGQLHTARGLTIFSATVLPVGLLFTSSKWNWHYAVLLPSAVIGWALMTQAVQSPALHGRLQRLSVVSIGVIGSGFGAAWALHEGRPWSDIVAFAFQRSVFSKSAESNWPLLFGPKSAWWVWVVASLLIGALVYLWARARRETRKSAGAWSIAFSTLSMSAAVAAFQLSPPIEDAIRNPREWTFVYQSVIGLFDSDVRCGVPAATFLNASNDATTTRESVQSVLNKTGGAMALPPQVVLTAPCSRAPEIRNGLQEIPSMIMGRLDLAGARLEAETTAVPWVCNSFPPERSSEYLCFSRLIKVGEPLTASEVTWRPWGSHTSSRP